MNDPCGCPPSTNRHQITDYTMHPPELHPVCLGFCGKRRKKKHSKNLKWCMDDDGGEHDGDGSTGDADG